MIKKTITLLLFGPVWWLLIMVFFILSGAQGILANPAYQSEKFIQVFTAIEPLPRMATSPYFIWIGMLIVGLFPASVFIFLHPKLRGKWWQKGLKYGLIHWALVTPWFEFYLPYNVMHEPLPLVLLETFLWLLVALGLGLIFSLLLRNTGPENN